MEGAWKEKISYIAEEELSVFGSAAPAALECTHGNASFRVAGI